MERHCFYDYYYWLYLGFLLSVSGLWFIWVCLQSVLITLRAGFPSTMLWKMTENESFLTEITCWLNHVRVLNRIFSAALGAKLRVWLRTFAYRKYFQLCTGWYSVSSTDTSLGLLSIDMQWTGRESDIGGTVLCRKEILHKLNIFIHIYLYELSWILYLSCFFLLRLLLNDILCRPKS